MTKEELKQIICSPKNKSGYFSKESTWDALYAELYLDLISWSFPSEFTFQQKVYHFLNNDPDLLLGLCLVCGKRCRFISSSKGYLHFCSKQCMYSSDMRAEKMKQTCLEKYGVENPFQSDEFKNKYKQTCLEKYGCGNPSQIEEIKEKKKRAYLEHYGVEHYSQTDEYKEKYKQTCMEKYGVENPLQNKEIHDKAKQTCLERYGVENPSQVEGSREKSKQTCLEKYGAENYTQTDEYKEKFKDVEWVKSIDDRKKQTCLEKYGTEYASQSNEVKEKSKQTCLEKYGVEYVFQNKEIQEKQKQTCLEKYGVDHYTQTDEFKDKYKDSEWVKSINEKSYQTKKANNSFSSSKIEDQLKEYFDLNGINYIHQYKSDLYPFNCDFYFPEYDLYVEIQGSWTHGGHPFTGSEEDLNTVKLWESKESEYYKNAIEVWATRDVKKRETAKMNKLNYLEIFSHDLATCVGVLEHQLTQS